MASWGSQANNAANSVIYAPAYVQQVPNTSNESALFQNTTSGAYKASSGKHQLKQAVGVWGVTTVAMNSANASSENKKVDHSGWVIRRQGTGPIISFAVSNTGATFGNGETVAISGGSANGIAALSTNSTGGLTGASVVVIGQAAVPAGFVNASSISFAFNREKHLANVTVTGATASFLNTDVIVCSNGSLNATATLTTNATGGISNTSFVITNVGLFGNTQANTNIVVTALAANGSASPGTGATFSVNIVTSTNGGLTGVVGGRAGRVNYETLVAGGSMVGGGSTLFPNT